MPRSTMSSNAILLTLFHKEPFQQFFTMEKVSLFNNMFFTLGKHKLFSLVTLNLVTL